MKRVNRILTFIAALLAIALLAAPASADCRAIVRNRVVVVPPVKLAIVPPLATIQTVTTTLPITTYANYSYAGSHGAIYNEGAAEDRKLIRDLIGQNQQLIDGLATLRERVRGAGKVDPVPPPMPGADSPLTPNTAPLQQDGKNDPVIPLFQARCASCHEATKAPTAGKGFVLFNGGSLARVTQKQFTEILLRVYSDDPNYQMPMGGKAFTDQEYALVQDSARSGALARAVLPK